jgi:hypothetical protein
MKDKSENSFEKAFLELKKIVQIKPKLNISDFEKALINSSRNVFVDCDSKGCLFHLSQSIWKRIGNLGLIKDYNSNLKFKILVKKLLLLAFVPIDDVIISFNLIKKEFETLKISNLAIFLEYFESNYLKRLKFADKILEKDGFPIEFGMLMKE